MGALHSPPQNIPFLQDSRAIKQTTARKWLITKTLRVDDEAALGSPGHVKILPPYFLVNAIHSIPTHKTKYSNISIWYYKGSISHQMNPTIPLPPMLSDDCPILSKGKGLEQTR